MCTTRWIRFFIGVLGALLPGCTVLSDFDVHVCQVDADCDILGETGMFCEKARCEPGCRNNHQCLERDPRSPLCTSRGGECVALTTDDGSCYLGSPYDDAALGELTLAQLSIIGAFSPDVESSTWLTLQLGIRELSESGGLTSSDGESRPPLLSICNDDPQTIVAATYHLFTDLGVSVVVASLGDDAIRAASSQPEPRGALWLSPFSTSSNNSDGRAPLTRYLQGTSLDATPLYPALAQRIADQRLAQDPGLPPPRVAVLTGEATEDNVLGGSVFEALTLDGLDSTTLQRLGRLKKFQLPDGDRLARSDAVKGLLGYAPDLVLVFAAGGYRGTSSAVLGEGLVALFADGESRQAPPMYVWGPRNSSDTRLLQAVLANPPIAARSLGVDLRRAGDDALSTALQERFHVAFPDAVTPLDPSVYDAFYFLAYASAAAPLEPDRRAALLSGFERISSADGTTVSVGPGADGIERVKRLLNQPGAMLAEGATGPAEFDPVTGVRPAEARVYCWGPSAQRDGVRTLARLVDTKLQPVATDCGAGVLDAP